MESFIFPFQIMLNTLWNVRAPIYKGNSFSWVEKEGQGK